MAKKKYKKLMVKGPLDYVSLPKIDLDPDIKRGIFIMLILAFGAISQLALFDLAGILGGYLEQLLTLLFGWGRWFFPVVMLSIGYLLYRKEKRGVKGATYLGLFIFTVSIHALFHFVIAEENWRAVVELGQGGGYLGLFMASTFLKILGFWASLIALACLLLISLMLIFNKTIGAMFGRESFFAKLFYPFNFILNKLFRRNARGEEEEEKISDDVETLQCDVSTEESEEYEDDELPGFNSHEVKAEPAFMQATADKAKAKPVEEENIWKPTHIDIDFPIDYLSPKIGKSVSGDIKENKEIIRLTFENFGIPVEMGEAEVGPTVTRYTLKPSEGIKLSRITELNSNLALALAARSIRIEAPIPGKSLVGIEVPNQANAVVGLREILTSNIFKQRKSNMMLALGKDVAGESCIYDLTDTPHLLVAGATKSGKSVGINSMIMGLLFQNPPDELRFIMVDPKRVELPVYNGIPHLLCPVVTDVPKTINVLRWCLSEMDRRLDLMGAKGNKNIQTYNKSSKQKMPYIVVVIDELADLMLLARKDIEGSLIRLLQMSRAVGIHLILATQRPSADIITGLIKANMPARIAYAVNSGIDSRTVLDSLGAEKLLGKGDMLFTTAESPKPKRVQGAFLSETEIKKIIRFLKEKGGEPQYLDGITDKQKGAVAGTSIGGGSDDYDEFLEEAKEIFINSGKASTSLLQRRLGVGYARAAKIIDQLEEIGVVGPANGSKPREILVSKEQYEAMLSEGVSGVSLHNREEAEALESYLPSDAVETLHCNVSTDDEPEEELNEEDEAAVEARDLTTLREGEEEKEDEEDDKIGDDKLRADLEEVYSAMDDMPEEGGAEEEDGADNETKKNIKSGEQEKKKTNDKNYHSEDAFDKLFSR